MKKLISIIVNIFLIIIVLISVELYCSYIDYKNADSEHLSKYEKIKEHLNFVIKTYYYFLNGIKDDNIIAKLSEGYFNNWEIRQENYSEYPNPAILLLGCSFTYGSSLSERESFHSILANQIKHPVYNLGIPSGSPREMLYILRNKEFLNYITDNNKDINYVVYTYISNHLTRLIYDRFIVSPYYIPVNNNTELKYKKKNKLLNSSFIYKHWENIDVDTMKHNMQEIKKEINKEYKNAQFIILVYNEEDELIDWERIQGMGIIVINVNDLIGENISTLKYQNSQTDTHPNSLAWKVIVPKLVKQLDIK